MTSESFLRERLPLRVLLVCAALLIGLTWHGINLTHPFANDVTEADAGDDWREYHLNALSIAQDGPLIVRAKGAYYQPAGFLYNYFIAAVFVVLGPQTGYVYAAHYVLLALGLGLLFLWALRELSFLAATIFVAVSLFVLLVELDVLRHKLLSENLVLLLYPAMLLLASIANRRRTLLTLGAAGAVTGLVLLTRPNLLPLPFLTMGALLIFRRERRVPQRLGDAAVYFVGTLCTFFLLPLRNLLASGHLVSASYATHLPSGPVREQLASIVEKALFCLGILPRVDGSGGWVLGNPRLLLLAVCGVLALLLLAKLRAVVFDDGMAVAVILAAYVPFAMLPMLGAYGYRFQSPYLPMFLYLAVRAMDVLARRRRESKAGRQPKGEATNPPRRGKVRR
jgi:hypothetical protein